MQIPAVVEFYLTLGPLTELPENCTALDDLRSDVPSIAKVVQGLLLHLFWAQH